MEIKTVLENVWKSVKELKKGRRKGKGITKYEGRHQGVKEDSRTNTASCHGNKAERRGNQGSQFTLN